MVMWVSVKSAFMGANPVCPLPVLTRQRINRNGSIRFPSKMKRAKTSKACKAKEPKEPKESEEKQMARKRMITRTVKGTRYNCLCLNTETCEPFNTEVILGEVFKSTSKRDNKLREMIDTETAKFVQVVDAEEVETLYGMEESKFIAGAEILPPRAVKEFDTVESEVC